MESHADDEEFGNHFHFIRVRRLEWPGLGNVNENKNIVIHHYLHLLAWIIIQEECSVNQQKSSNDEKQKVASLSFGGGPDLHEDIAVLVLKIWIL